MRFAGCHPIISDVNLDTYIAINDTRILNFSSEGLIVYRDVTLKPDIIQCNRAQRQCRQICCDGADIPIDIIDLNFQVNTGSVFVGDCAFSNGD